MGIQKKNKTNNNTHQLKINRSNYVPEYLYSHDEIQLHVNVFLKEIKHKREKGKNT
jgi:hypothetical protein